jgi:hypothetical protein
VMVNKTGSTVALHERERPHDLDLVIHKLVWDEGGVQLA